VESASSRHQPGTSMTNQPILTADRPTWERQHE
jgi:hypothetical protein